MPKSPKKISHPAPPPLQITDADVFILESLTLENERDGRCEGRILADVLRMCGKKPVYYYFRTEAELVELAEEFSSSGYRFLHLSCHGSADELDFTLDKISYTRFGEIFGGKLKNRRLFLSACELGNDMFAEVILGRNKGMYSVAGPETKIRFEHAAGFWSAFYGSRLANDKKFLKNPDIIEAFGHLCPLFKVPFHFTYHDTYNQKIRHKTIKA